MSINKYTGGKSTEAKIDEGFPIIDDRELPPTKTRINRLSRKDPESAAIEYQDYNHRNDQYME